MRSEILDRAPAIRAPALALHERHLTHALELACAANPDLRAKRVRVISTQRNATQRNAAQRNATQRNAAQRSCDAAQHGDHVAGARRKRRPGSRQEVQSTTFTLWSPKM
jgi:hypothetical protein